ncbi:glycosyltransferase family 39 protein [Pontimicrobium sp. SW4]|uniref:Glycosyltransferase family 39 protein n=1 Tax=Pontimicrobium sp. SW4 TaxID=3153519 RepID=A0AAU7BV21_9FLAO
MLKNAKQQSAYIFYSIIVIIALRFILTGLIPLLDKTESRYSEIARLMYETQDWVVLQIDYGVPFWAKPPLSTWLSAASYQVFGVNEIAARLPYFLVCLLLVFILGKFVKQAGKSFYLPAFILLTTPEFLLHAGVVSTDAVLCLSITLIMISFWKSIENEKRSFWNYLFFISIALGLLSKGPIVLVLTAPPLFIWLFIQKVSIKKVWNKIPWLTGILITIAIALPWYLFAENRSPGFLDYFIVGEHFKRFVVSGWEGDLYGSGHRQPLGMIWVFLLVFSFPWIQFVLIKLWKERKTILKNKWVSFLVLWLLWTPFFFTASKNILHTYTLPVTIPIALLMVYYWHEFKNKKLLFILGSIFPFLVIVATCVVAFGDDKLLEDLNTDKYIVEKLIENDPNTPIYYWEKKSYSSRFYSSGDIKVIKETSIDSIYNSHDKFIMLIRHKKIKTVPNKFQEKMVRIDSIKRTSVFMFEK